MLSVFSMVSIIRVIFDRRVLHKLCNTNYIIISVFKIERILYHEQQKGKQTYLS